MTGSQIYTPQRKPARVCHDIRGIEYSVAEWGDRRSPLLVLLHGWGDCADSFQFLVDELAHDWFVVAPDWRGFGQTDCRASSYWFPDYIADLDALLGIYSPDAPVNLLGHSMGANAAGLYAGIFPERVRNFVNVEGFGLADSDPATAPATYRRWIESGRQSLRFSTYPSYDALAARIQKRSPRLPDERARYVATCWARAGDDGTVVLRADPAHKLPNAVQYRRAEARACWEKVTADVLLVIGANTDFKSELKSWLDPDESQHPFRGARSVVIPDTGHMVHFESPAALAAAAEAFMQAR
jgi:pimeloyl-ACP methyl ester carboxylesterase